jgi:hypothetical protein
MKRRLLNLLTILSLLLFAATAAVWARAQSASEGAVANAGGNIFHVLTARRGLYFAVFSKSRQPVRTQWTRRTPDDHGPAFIAGHPAGGRLLGFRYRRVDLGSGYSYDTVHYGLVPYWAILTAAAAAGCLSWRLAGHRRHYQPGLCPACGYDLRATPGRCPECGDTPAGAKS